MSAENLAAADEQVTQEVTTLVRRYFELLYTNDLDLFAQVFDPGAHLYGLNEKVKVRINQIVFIDSTWSF